MKTPILLASSSPQRRFLLESLGFEVFTKSPDIDETPFLNESPQKMVLRLAQAKLEKILETTRPPYPVLAADTTVFCQETLIGKPENKEDAKKILQFLSGKPHFVYTGFSIYFNNKLYSKYIETQIIFRNLSQTEINQYVETGESEGKAGAYAIQSQASSFCHEIHGSYPNIIGLPLQEVCEGLQHLGATLPYDT